MKVLISIYAIKMFNGNEIVLFMTDVSLLCVIKNSFQLLFGSCYADNSECMCCVCSDASLISDPMFVNLFCFKAIRTMIYGADVSFCSVALISFLLNYIIILFYSKLLMTDASVPSFG